MEEEEEEEEEEWGWRMHGIRTGGGKGGLGQREALRHARVGLLAGIGRMGRLRAQGGYLQGLERGWKGSRPFLQQDLLQLLQYTIQSYMPQL